MCQTIEGIFVKTSPLFTTHMIRWRMDQIVLIEIPAGGGGGTLEAINRLASQQTSKWDVHD